MASRYHCYKNVQMNMKYIRYRQKNDKAIAISNMNNHHIN